MVDPTGGERWHVEAFDTPEVVASFLNHVEVTTNQLVSMQYQALSPTAQRFVVTCRLTAAQLELRQQWLAVERALTAGAATVA